MIKRAAVELPRRAEKQARSRAPSSESPQTVEELQRLLRELKARQTELELQNEELRNSAALLLQTQRIAMVGGWEYDIAKRRIAWTEEVYRIYEVAADYDPNDIDRAVSFYAPEVQAQIAEAFRRAIEQGEPYDLELPFVGARGTRKWVRTTGNVERSAGSVRRVFGDIMDITARKQAELTLAEFSRDFEAFLEHTTDFIYFQDTDSRVRFCSQSLAQICNYASWRDMIGKHGPEVFSGIAAWMDCSADRLILAEGKPSLNKIDAYQDAAGRARFVQSNKLPLFDADGTVVGIFGIGHDVTEHVTQQEYLDQQIREHTTQLRSIAIELAMVEERERQAIAEELHDGLCQTLVVGKLKLSALAAQHKDCPHYASMQQHIKNVEAVIDEADQVARSLSLQLSPPVLYELGLMPALEWLAEEMHYTYGLRVNVRDDGEPKFLDKTVRNPIFRAVRELLINVAKHAQVDVAELTARCLAGQLLLSVADAGVGFDLNQGLPPSAKHSFGLSNVRERIGFVGGEMHIDSSPGNGTVVVLTVALSEVEPD